MYKGYPQDTRAKVTNLSQPFKFGQAQQQEEQKCVLQ